MYMYSPFVFDRFNDVVTGTAPARLDVCGFSCFVWPFQLSYRLFSYSIYQHVTGSSEGGYHDVLVPESGRIFC